MEGGLEVGSVFVVVLWGIGFCFLGGFLVREAATLSQFLGPVLEEVG